MEEYKVKSTASMVFGAIAWIGYIAMHIYFTYVALTEFTTLWAMIVLLIPAFGDILLIALAIGIGNWIPLIVFGAVLAIIGLSSLWSKISDK